MTLLNKCFYNRWNIGFIEQPVSDIISGTHEDFKIIWVKHKFTDRFFADPFILDVNENQIDVLVEEYLYATKIGVISLLTINRHTYELLNRKVILSRPYHQSYPFIWRQEKDIYVLPEASMSGNLYVYKFNPITKALENGRILINEPLLDSTITEFQGKFFLFCTKRGAGSNRDLYIYEADQPLGEYHAISTCPVLSDLNTSRPAGATIRLSDGLYRITQVCEQHYGEYMKLFRIQKCNKTEFQQQFIKNLRPEMSEFSRSFHTLNSFGDLTVVDGTKREFRPFLRLYSELKHKLLRNAYPLV